MRIAILADIHDHVWNLEAALPRLREADAVLCCGDLCSPFVLDQMASSLHAPVHIVFGNNDGDLFRLTAAASEYDHLRLHGTFFRGSVGGVQVAMTHYPEVAEAVDPDDLDLIAYGHDHTLYAGRRGRAHLVDPGSLMGFRPGHGDVAATFAVFDATGGRVDVFRIARDGQVEEHAAS